MIENPYVGAQSPIDPSSIWAVTSLETVLSFRDPVPGFERLHRRLVNGSWHSSKKHKNAARRMARVLGFV